MILSIASGKGGTGKTTLALLLAASRKGAIIADCDVEAPNCHLFLQPKWATETRAGVMVPRFDPDKCDGCGRCVQYCLFNALAVAGGTPLLFPELCHGCGGCLLACPHEAVSEERREIGVFRTGVATRNIPGQRLISGLLDVGTPAAAPLIKAMKKQLPYDADLILDCPPGASCSMVAAIAGSDYCLLVTEPTPFGLHDLELAAGVSGMLAIPHGVVINKSDGERGDEAVEGWCAAHGVELLARLPNSREFAAKYAAGIIDGEYREAAETLWRRLDREYRRRSDG